MPRVSEPDAIALLQSGALVAIPTETVYGLAARIDRPESIARIFAAKGRPSFNPLIVHAPSVSDALALATKVSPLAQKLAEKFWPGPLTLVLPRHPRIPSLVTAGQDTVALRVPAHPVALSVLRGVGIPLAAPSANRSTTLSPTTADHVLASLGEATAVLDGGAATRGLESTVVRPTETAMEVLRLGALALEDFADFGAVKLVTVADGTPSPGMQLRHYAPKLPLRLVDDVKSVSDATASEAALLTFRPHREAGRFRRAIALSPKGSLPEAAACLFDVLHQFQNDRTLKAIVATLFPTEGLGLAINDRLRRGAER